MAIAHRRRVPNPFHDLSARWRHARRAALRAQLPESGPEAGDDDLLAAGLAANADDATKRVFDNSLRLGVGFTRAFDKELSLGELPAALSELEAPCLAGTWAPAEGDEPALTLARDGCPAAKLGPAACEFWREAIDGLVLGITGGIRHARHESVGHGGARCFDVVYVRPESPLRFGAIPSEIRDALEEVRRTAATFDSTVRVDFMGISQETLYYQLTRAGCGGDLSISSVVERAVRRRLPDLKLREISPRPVLGTDA